MYCEIYPFKRLPRRFDFFDYKIPDTLQLNIGDLVRIPFRNQLLFGVVARIKSESSFKRISEVKECIEPNFLSAASLNRLLHISEVLVQSPSTILHFAYGNYRARKKLPEILVPIQKPYGGLTQNQIDHIKSCLHDSDFTFAQMSTEEVFGFSLAITKSTHQTLILCPTARYAEQLSALGLPSSAVLHGKTAPPQREAVMRAWKQGHISTLIGTRLSTLLEPHKLTHVIVCESASDDYRFLDRNPRFDARMAAQALAHQHHAACTFTSPFPFVHSYTDVHLTKSASVSLVVLGTEGERTTTPFLSKQLQAALRELPENKKALLFFNRKGGAKQLQCHDCGYTVLCGTCHHIARMRKDDLICDGCQAEMWIPTSCPSCKGNKLSPRGLGNQQLKQKLQKAFPKKSIGIIDKDEQDPDADIILATEYYFKQLWRPFLPQTYGIVAELHFEQQLYDDSFHAVEYAGYALHRLANLAKQQRAKCVVQVWEKDAVNPLLNTANWLDDELAMRKTYKLPPYGYHALVQEENETKPRIVRANSQNLEKTLEDLKKLPDSAIITAETSYVAPKRPNAS